MNIQIDEATKARIARIGPVRTFGDYDSRKKLNDTELATLFDTKWELGLRQAVENSLPCEFDVAQSRLQGKQTDFIDPDQEQRQFRFQSMSNSVGVNNMNWEQLKKSSLEDITAWAERASTVSQNANDKRGNRPAFCFDAQNGEGSAFATSLAQGATSAICTFSLTLRLPFHSA